MKEKQALFKTTLHLKTKVDWLRNGLYFEYSSRFLARGRIIDKTGEQKKKMHHFNNRYMWIISLSYNWLPVLILHSCCVWAVTTVTCSTE